MFQEATNSRAMIRDVSRRTPGETENARIERLARKAVLSGVRIMGEYNARTLFATSGTNAARLYRIDLHARTCTCEGFTRTNMCKHLALALTAYNFAEPAIESSECTTCRGERGWKRQCGGGLSDWVWEECSSCNGRGSVEVAPHAPEQWPAVELTYNDAWALASGAMSYAAYMRQDQRKNGIRSWAVAKDIDAIEQTARDVRKRLDDIRQESGR